MKKIGRNDPCVCGSGKKFKKCCERKMIGKRFMASKIEAPKVTSNIASFFRKQINQINTEKEKTPTNEVPNKTTIQENQDQQISDVAEAQKG